MLEYLAQNFGYILVAGVLLLIVAAIILRMVRNRRAGKGGCGHGCAGCAHAGTCHAHREENSSPLPLTLSVQSLLLRFDSHT